MAPGAPGEGRENEPDPCCARGVAALAVAALLGGGGGAALGAAPGCNLAPQLRDLTINQGLGSYTPLAWGKDTLFRLYMSQPSCAASGALIQVTGATLTVGEAAHQDRVRDDTKFGDRPTRRSRPIARRLRSIRPGM